MPGTWGHAGDDPTFDRMEPDRTAKGECTGGRGAGCKGRGNKFQTGQRTQGQRTSAECRGQHQRSAVQTIRTGALCFRAVDCHGAGTTHGQAYCARAAAVAVLVQLYSPFPILMQCTIKLRGCHQVHDSRPQKVCRCSHQALSCTTVLMCVTITRLLVSKCISESVCTCLANTSMSYGECLEPQYCCRGGLSEAGGGYYKVGAPSAALKPATLVVQGCCCNFGLWSAGFLWMCCFHLFQY